MDTLQGTEDSRAQLDQWMNERRQELRLRWSQVADLAGMGSPNLLRIRKGKISISWDAADGIESALQWERGSVERAVRDGQKPTPAVIREDLPPEPAAMFTEEDRQRFAVIQQLFDTWGIEMTPRMLDVWHDEVGRQLLARRQQGPATDSDRSYEDSDRSPDRGTGK